MSKEELKLQQSLEAKKKSWSKVSIELDYVKDNVVDIVENDERTKILKKYWVLNTRRKSEYSFLTQIYNLPLFIDILSKLYPTRWGLLERNVLKKYHILWREKWFLEKIQYLWLWVLKNDVETPLNVKDRYDQWIDPGAYQITNDLDFLGDLDILKLDSNLERLWIFYKQELIDNILLSEKFRNLISYDLDNFIKINQAITWFTYKNLEKLVKDDINQHYDIFYWWTIEKFIELIRELKLVESDNNLFDLQFSQLHDFYVNYWDKWINNLIYLNSVLKWDSKFSLFTTITPIVDDIESIFKIDTESLKRVANIVWEDKVNLFHDDIFYIQINDIVKSSDYKTNSEKVDLLEYFHSHFWDRFFYDADINFSINNTALTLDEIKTFIAKHDINWNDWIKFLNFIFSWWSNILLENYNKISDELGNLFSAKELLSNYLEDDRISLVLKKIFVCPAENYIYLFKKFKNDFLAGKEWFLRNLRDHFWVAWEGGLWLRNIENIENIFWFDISYEEFTSVRWAIIIWADLKEQFTFLNELLPWKIKSLEELSEFNTFYNGFNWWIKEYHKFFLEKLDYLESDFKNGELMKSLSILDEGNQFVFEDLEEEFWLDNIKAFLWKKDDIKNALSYAEEYIFAWKNIVKLMSYIWKSKIENKYKQFWSLLFKIKSNFMFNKITQEQVDKVIKIIDFKWIDTPPFLVAHFMYTKSIEEEEKLFNNYDEVIDNYISLKWIKTDYWFELDCIDKVYNWVSSYTPDNLDQYEDNTYHLDNYSFDRDWYKMLFSWLSWYRLKEWEEVDEDLMTGFRNRVENIWELSKWDIYLHNFMLPRVREISSDFKFKNKKIEWWILQYLKEVEKVNWKLEIEDMDVILAYQLRWKFDDFRNWSNDKVSKVDDEYSKNAFQLEALINEYWDNLKETINLLEKKIVESDDPCDLEVLWTKQESIEETSEYKNLTKDRLFEQIIKSFINIPEEKLTFQIIEKSLTIRLSSVLQWNKYLQQNLLDFINRFELEDFINLKSEFNQKNLRKKFNKSVLEFLISNHKIDLDLSMIKRLQWDIYKQLKQENDKYEEVKEKEEKSNWKLIEKSSKDRHVMWYFSKTKEQAKARWVWWVCIWADPEMWKNEDYFEFVLMDIDRKVNIWTTMLLHIDDNNKKYLLFWPNPSEEFTGKVSAKDLYYQILWQVSDFAQNNWYDWIILDTTHGKSTNRWWAFQTVLENSVLKDDNWEELKINLQKHHKLWGWYDYKNWLNFVWKK